MQTRVWEMRYWWFLIRLYHVQLESFSWDKLNNEMVFFNWMPPFFTTLYPMTPFLFFLIKQICKIKKKCVKITWILFNLHPMTPLLQTCHPMTPFLARKLSVMAPWFDASVGASSSLLYAGAPHQNNACLPAGSYWGYISNNFDLVRPAHTIMVTEIRQTKYVALYCYQYCKCKL